MIGPVAAEIPVAAVAVNDEDGAYDEDDVFVVAAAAAAEDQRDLEEIDHVQ